ncbi:hypothetical protein Tco_0474738 [Tanacetum coccineum]
MLLPPTRNLSKRKLPQKSVNREERRLSNLVDEVDEDRQEELFHTQKIFEIGKSSSKIHQKHHENQIEDILNYLEELSFLRIGKMEEDNKLKTELEKVRS